MADNQPSENPLPGAPGGEVGGAGGSSASASVPRRAYVLDVNSINPREFECNPISARFFVIKSYTAEDIHKAIKVLTHYSNKKRLISFPSHLMESDNIVSASFISILTQIDVLIVKQHGTWSSTDTGCKRLNAAWTKSSSQGPIYLFYSENGSGMFCGMAQMTSGVDYNSKVCLPQRIEKRTSRPASDVIDLLCTYKHHIRNRSNISGMEILV